MARSIRVSKDVVDVLPDGYSETFLGDPKGSLRQYRHSSGAHVREYDKSYEIHMDRSDPRSDPIAHLVKDAPGSLLSLVFPMLLLNLAGLLLGVFRPSLVRRLLKAIVAR